MRSAGAELNDVWFTDADHGWAVGDFATILATVDGGVDWIPLSAAKLSPVAEIAAVCFVDEKTGCAAGNAIDSTFTMSTTDGGRTWRVRDAPGRGYPFDICFVDERHGWFVGAVGSIYSTSDGGRHWRRQRSGVEKDEAFLNGVCFVDRERGWVVGGSDEGPVLLSTIDGGSHWERRDCGAPDELLGVTFSDATHGCVVGRKSFVAVTADGRSWLKRKPDPNSRAFYEAFALDAQMMWAIGEEGMIWVTEDGGQTWMLQHSGTSANLAGISVISD